MSSLKRYIIAFCILSICLLWVVFSLANADGQPPKKSLGGDKIIVIRKINLPDLLVETSGLIYFNDLVWTFNDSGGEPELYSYSIADTAVVQRITIWNGKNYDWEEVTQDRSSIYIGDFGNNFGMRNNLCIYKVDKTDLPRKRKNKAVKAEKIHFTYPDYQPVLFSLRKRSF